METFKKLHINIPIIKALAQMPKYMKFLKELLSKKKRLEDLETVALTGECSAILQNKLPPKIEKSRKVYHFMCHWECGVWECFNRLRSEH